MARKSAGIVMYRRAPGGISLFLVHPGGPFWTKKDAGAWSFPKGEYTDNEDPLTVAKREFREETGFSVDGEFVRLAPVTQGGGKTVQLFAVEGDCDATAIRSNTFSMEWPPQSGQRAKFPEVDRAGWFPPDEAREKLNPAQATVVDEICDRLGGRR
jgi:predicted NUDIX family NTP pyrophosphohydrolase